MEGYIAQIKLFAGDFAPRTWAYCQGQTMIIAQNSALFSLLGTTYGGNGQVTFGLPNFAGRVAIGTGSNYVLGEMSGSENISLSPANLPAHTHAMSGTVRTVASATANIDSPDGAVWAQGANSFSKTKNTAMNSGAITANLNVGIAGSSSPVGNAQPSLGMNYIICLYGIYPSRNY